MTPAGVVAIKLLRALRIDTVEQARPILAQWAARPRLAPGDIRDVLAELAQGPDPARGDDPRGTEYFDPSEMPPRGTVRHGEHDADVDVPYQYRDSTS